MEVPASLLTASIVQELIDIAEGLLDGDSDDKLAGFLEEAKKLKHPRESREQSEDP